MAKKEEAVKKKALKLTKTTLSTSRVRVRDSESNKAVKGGAQTYYCNLRC